MKRNIQTTNKERIVYDTELIGTWETLSKIEEQYKSIDSNLNKEGELIIKYIENLSEFEKKVFYLYTEYNSYRKVSYETNCGKDTIMNIIRKIQKDIINDKHK